MSDNEVDVLLAIEVGGVPIELVGEFTDDVVKVGLTDYAKQILREVSLPSIGVAVAELLAALKITDLVGDLDFRGELESIPGVDRSISALLEAPIHLTDLEYEKDKKVVIGVLIDLAVDLGVMKVSQVGLKISHTFEQTTPEPA